MNPSCASDTDDFYFCTSHLPDDNCSFCVHCVILGIPCPQLGASLGCFPAVGSWLLGFLVDNNHMSRVEATIL